MFRFAPLMLIAVAMAACGRPSDSSSLPTLAAAPTAAQGNAMNQSPSAEPVPYSQAAPLVYQGVRYEEDSTSPTPAGQIAGGLLVAFDSVSGQRLWQLQVYRLEDKPGAPMAHPGVHFKSITAVPGQDALLVENQSGGQYRVDLSQRQARQVGGPPEEALPTPPAKPKPKP
jgi:hypothetical protein